MHQQLEAKPGTTKAVTNIEEELRNTATLPVVAIVSKESNRDWPKGVAIVWGMTPRKALKAQKSVHGPFTNVAKRTFDGGQFGQTIR